MSQEQKGKRYGQHKKVDPSTFGEAKKPATSTSALAEKYRHDAELVVTHILRKEGVTVDCKVQAAGKRVIVELQNVAQEIMYHLSSLIANALRELQQTLFGTNRFTWHHTVQINGKRLAYSG